MAHINRARDYALLAHLTWRLRNSGHVIGRQTEPFAIATPSVKAAMPVVLDSCQRASVHSARSLRAIPVALFSGVQAPAGRSTRGVEGGVKIRDREFVNKVF
jgi:hypothetical protein